MCNDDGWQGIVRAAAEKRVRCVRHARPREGCARIFRLRCVIEGGWRRRVRGSGEWREWAFSVGG